MAVMAVVLFHLKLGLPGGYIGVDVFFVISGFLITGIILRGMDQSTFSLAEFWERRFRRIVPALFVMVAATLAAGYCLLLPHDLEQLGESSVAQALLVANVCFWRDTGYFAGPSELKPLLHTWSLAVEEQFYLAFPLLLVFFKTQDRKKLFWGLAWISVISLGGSVYGTLFHPGATFFLLPTRAWELLVGCLLAVLPWKCVSRPRRDSAVAMAGLLAILVPACFYSSKTPFPGLAAIPPVCGAAAVIFATGVSPETSVARMLSLRPIVFVGLISYSLYLWHWPVIVYVRTYWGYVGWKQIILATLCSLLLSIISWRFIETPFRRPASQPSRRRLLGVAVSMAAATLTVGILFVVSGGVPTRFPNYSRVLLEDTLWNGTEFSLPIREELKISKLPTLGRNLKRSDSPIDFIVWGDSHGMTISTVINEVAAEVGLSGKAILHSGIPPVPNCYRPNKSLPSETRQRQNEIVELLKNSRPRHLLLVARWSFYTDGYSELDGHHDRLILSDSPAVQSTAPPPGQVLSRNLVSLADFCEKHGIVLWILKQVPETGERRPAKEWFLFTVGKKNSLSDNRCTVEDHARRQANVESVFQSIQSSAVRFVDPAPAFFDSLQRTVNYRGGRSLYRDNHHVTRWGAAAIRKPLLKMFQEMAALR